MHMWIYQHGLRLLTTIICAFLKVKVTETDCPARDINYPQGRGKDKASNLRQTLFINKVFTAVTKVT